ncbi:MAG: hypothetical protein QXY79_04080 [Candidatus Methanomethylicia archaeon]
MTFHKSKFKIFFISFIIILLNSFLLSLNYPLSLKNNRVNIKIHPEPKSNPLSKENEIWIKLIEVDTKSINLKKLKNNNWEFKNNALVNYKNKNYIDINLNYSESYNLCFLKHPYSGIAKIVINNKEIIILDLYEKKFNLNCIYKTIYPNGKPIKNEILKYFLSFIFYLISHILILKLIKKIYIKKEIIFNYEIFNKLIYLASLSLLFIFLLIYWPGIYSIDSFDQINQSLNSKIRDNHPALLTLYYSIVLFIFKKKEFLIIFQLILLAFTLQIFINFLKNKKNEILFLILFLINPVNLYMSITLWKDIPYSYGLLGFLMCLFYIFYSKNKNVWFILLLNFYSFTIIFSRHNGILTFLLFNIFLFLLLFLIYKFSKLKLYFINILIIFFIFIFTKNFLYSKILNINNIFTYSNKNKNNVLNNFIPHIYYLSKDNIIELNKNNKYYSHLNRILPIEKLKNIQGYPYYADLLFRNKNLNFYYLYDKNTMLFFKEYVLTNPKNFIKNFLKNYSLIWKVIPYPDAYTYIPTDELQYLTKNNCKNPESYEYCNYIIKSYFPKIKNFTDNMARKIKENYIILWRPAFYLILSNFLALLIINITQNLFLITPLFIIYSNIIPYFLILLPQDFRYFYINVLIFYFYLFLFFNILSKKKLVKNIKSSSHLLPQNAQ